jgi:hypothetical protein
MQLQKLTLIIFLFGIRVFLMTIRINRSISFKS